MKALNYLKNKKFLAWSLPALIIGCLASFAIVSAAIPDTNGKINACYKNTTKILRITDPAGSCDANETAISWRQDGGQIISNRVSVAFEQANNQQILNIPGFGEFRVAGSCNGQTAPSIKYVNSTSHGVEAGNFDIFEPLEETEWQSNIVDMQLGYSEGNVNHVANVTSSYVIDLTTSSCNFQAQATISEN